MDQFYLPLACANRLSKHVNGPLAMAEGGKMVEFQVGNLDGVEGKMGTFVIEIHTDWDPVGTERFKVTHPYY